MVNHSKVSVGPKRDAAASDGVKDLILKRSSIIILRVSKFYTIKSVIILIYYNVCENNYSLLKKNP